MELSYISSKKAFLIFREMELFTKTSYILGNGVFRAGKIKKPTLKKFLIFREMELFSSKLKKGFIFFLKKNACFF